MSLSPRPRAKPLDLPKRVQALSALSEAELCAQERGLVLKGKLVALGMALLALPPAYGFMAMLGLADPSVAFFFLGFIPWVCAGGVACAILDSKHQRLRPLSEASEAEREEALALVKASPEARELARTARASGRQLRGFDLEALRAAGSERKSARLSKELERMTSPSRADLDSEEA